MAARPLRIGVVGTGQGSSVHLPALRQIADVDVVAVCGTDKTKAAAVAARFGIPASFDDFRTMIREADLDGVTIAAPVEQHHPLAIAAIEEGLHILCEAPMARNAAEARDMHRLARDAGIQHVVSFATRFTPARMRFKQLVDGGYLGDLQSISVTAYRLAPKINRYRQGYLDDVGEPLSLIQSVGSEYVDIMRWWFGDVHGVAGAKVEGPLGEIGASQPGANFAFVVQFASGAIGTIHCSGSSPVDLGDEVVAIGTNGIMGLRGPTHLFGTRRDEQMIKDLAIPTELSAAVPQTPDPRVGSFMILAYEWVQGILSGECQAPSFEDGMKVQEVVDGAVRSQDLARWVDTSGKKWPL